MTALKRQVADRKMGFNESEIRRKMDEIADWLKDQPSLPAEPPRPKEAQPVSRALQAPAPANATPSGSTLESIAAGRAAARRQREEDNNRTNLRSLLDRFPGPLDHQDAPAAAKASARGPLSSAVAEIMERQRELDDHRPSRPSQPDFPAPRAEENRPEPFRTALSRTDARNEEPRREPPRDMQREPHRDRGAEMEATFERFVARFEARADQTFQTLETSLGEVRRLLDEAKTPVEAAEAAAAYIVQTRIHDLETGTNAKIEEVARGLADLRTETSESERRTRDLLDEVRATIEQVAMRLPERHGLRPLPSKPVMPVQPLAAVAPEPPSPPSIAPAPSAAEPEPNITLRVREAARRAMEDSAEEEPLNLGPRINAATPERRRFIAAARRSTQDGEEPVLNYRAAGRHAPRAHPLPEREPEKTSKRGSAGIRRILLTGTAAAVLILGVYAGSSFLLDGLTSSQNVAEVEQQEPQHERAIPAAPPRQVTQVDPVSPNSSLFSTSPVSGAANFAEPDPVVTGSIPSAPQLPPLPALPEAIGGEQLRHLAATGDAAAQYEIGMRLAEGRGVERDPALAAQWLERAADQGLAPAQYRLASLLEKGTGVAKDLPAARDLYEKAARAGNVQAMHNLGVVYAEGGLGQPDLAAAFDWFRKAADHGVKDSQYNLGIFYAKGLATTQDFAQSYVWFALAAAQGDKDAAAKRDQIAAKIDAERVMALRVTVDTWQPKAAAPAANTVSAPADGWEAPRRTSSLSTQRQTF